jgi:RND family efflux transporter MFP subunit
VVVSSALVVCPLFATIACERKSVEQVETTAPVPVVIEAAKVDMLRSTIDADGTVAPAPGAELTVVAPAPARIAELPKAEGDAVRQGDVLVRFDIPSLSADLSARRASVTQASARVEAARANFSRLSGLLAQGVAAPREVEDAKRAQAEAEADLEQARSSVDAAVALSERAVVKAQFAGVIAKRFHNPGDLVDASASDPVLKVINPAALQVVAKVPVGALTRVVIGHAATVFGPGADAGEAARVLTRPAQVDPASATADVRLAFTRPTQLASGTAVRVEIVGEEHPAALVIPAASVVREEDETFVMVDGPDNKAHKYPVAIGLTTQALVEITSGLKAGDRVIVRGQDGLPEGAAVTVVQK